MATNHAAVKFVKQMAAAFCNYQPAKEKLDLYVRKLNNWKLTQEQWDKSLDRLIEARPEREINKGLPELSEIYPILKLFSRATDSGAGNTGWAYFRIKRYEYAIRIKAVDGKWLISDLQSVSKGDITHLQPNYGQPIFEHVPVDAEDFMIRADNPIRDGNEFDISDEIKELISATSIKLRNVNRKNL